MDSITRFLTLPTVTKRNKTKSRDPIFDFTKSHILTSDKFTTAMQRLKESRENAAKEKERKAVEKEETKKRKATEREEAQVAKLLAREEAARAKSLRAAMRAEEQARKHLERPEATNLKVHRAAASKAAEAAEMTQRAHELQEAQRLRMMGIAQTTNGCQPHRLSVEMPGRELHGLRLDLSPLPQDRLPQFFMGSPSPFNAMVSNHEVPVHHFGTHMQSTTSPDPLQARNRYVARSQFPAAFQSGASTSQPSAQ